VIFYYMPLLLIYSRGVDWVATHIRVRGCNEPGSHSDHVCCWTPCIHAHFLNRHAGVRGGGRFSACAMQIGGDVIRAGWNVGSHLSQSSTILKIALCLPNKYVSKVSNKLDAPAQGTAFRTREKRGCPTVYKAGGR